MNHAAESRMRCPALLQHADDIESLFLLTKEGFTKSALDDFSAQRQALNRFYIPAC